MKKISALILISFVSFILNSTLIAQTIKSCDPGDDKPPCPQVGCMDSLCNCPEPGDSIKMPVLIARDPNAIVGTSGYDTIIKWVSINATLPYKIYFENDPEFATGPAQKVIIYCPLHTKLNPGSLRLGDFGFGSFNFSVPVNSSYYTSRVDVRDSLGVFVDVTAGLDITNRSAFWIFESIDPATGLASTVPANMGFLPVNDSMYSRGEGYVNFTMQPVSNAQTRDTATAQASIIFDINDSIPTNTWKNTIDAVAPQSHITLGTASHDTLHIFWTGQDDNLGSGVQDYALYYSENGGPFTLYKDKIAALQTDFMALPGKTYCFFTRARDNTGNLERLKDSCELTIIGNPLPVSWLYFNGNQQATYNDLNWATANEQNTAKFFVERSKDGQNFTDIGNRAAAGNSSVTRRYNYKDYEGVKLPATVLYYRIRQVDIDGRFQHSNVVPIRNKHLDNGLMVKVYPNPFSQTLMVDIKSAAAASAKDRIELYSNSGIMIYSRTLANGQTNSVITLSDLGSLPAGLYYLKVVVNGVIEVIKVVKN